MPWGTQSPPFPQLLKTIYQKQRNKNMAVPVAALAWVLITRCPPLNAQLYSQRRYPVKLPKHCQNSAQMMLHDNQTTLPTA